MKPLFAVLFAFICVATICCRREIPDPPVKSQVNGIPAGTGPCEASFYSTTPGRSYTLTIDGNYQGTVVGSIYVPGCGSAGTANFNLSSGSHTVTFNWVQGSSSGSGAFSFTLGSSNCQLIAL